MLRICISNLSKRLGINGYPVSLLPTCKHSNTPNTEADQKVQQETIKGESKRLEEFRKKLRETSTINDLGDQPSMHPSQVDDALPPWPDNTNPHTGEIGGPRGPEPTRYGDWERKGRVSDF